MARKLTVSTITGAIAVGLIVIVVMSLTSNGGSVAFAQVLKHLHGSAYTFKTVVGTDDDEGNETRASVLPPGRMRYDAPTGIGDVSAIVNVDSSESIILFHRNKAAIKRTPTPEDDPEVAGLFAFCVEPIEQLWGLRDGDEELLGTKEIDGQVAEGFKVTREGKRQALDITIWADVKSGIPILVKIRATSRHDPNSYGTVTMSDFELRDYFDPALFSLDAPTGYTLAYSKTLDEVDADRMTSAEADRIVEMLSLWSDGNEDKAIESLTTIDWTQPIEFAGRPYLFALSEAEYIALNPDDQQAAMTETMDQAKTIRMIARELMARAKQASAKKDDDRAVSYLDAGWHLGDLLSRDPESMVIVRLVGLAVQKLMLAETIELHKTTGDTDALQEAERLLRLARDDAAAIKKLATGR